VSQRTWTVDDSTGQRIEWNALVEPPMFGDDVLHDAVAIAALSSREPHEVVWYGGPENRYLLLIAWSDGGEEYFEFERQDGEYVFISSRPEICVH
jgi:hypothetical protein